MSAEIIFRGTDDFMRKLREIANEYPRTAEKHLRAIGNKLKKRAMENTPEGKTAASYTTKKGKTRKSKNKLKNSWTAKVVGIRGHSLEYQLRSTSRRYHLVERGHVIKNRKGGPRLGFVQGRFFFKRTVDEFKSSGEIKKQLEKFMQEIQRKAGG